MARPANHPIRIVRRNRRRLAAVLAAAAVLTGWQALRPEATQTVSLVVAARPIHAGSRLVPGDVALAEVAAVLAPAGAFRDPDQAVGAVTAVPLDAGEPLSGVRLLNATLGQDPQRPTSRPMPLRLSDPGAAALVRPGNRIDIISSGQQESVPSSAAVVARDVLVLANLYLAHSSDPGLFGDSPSAGTSQGALLLVSVEPDQALSLAAAEATSRLTFLVRE